MSAAKCYPSFERMSEIVEEQRTARDAWRNNHRVQVAVVESVLPTIRMAIIVVITVTISPLLAIVWLSRWLCTGNTWPLRSEP